MRDTIPRLPYLTLPYLSVGLDFVFLFLREQFGGGGFMLSGCLVGPLSVC